MKLQEIIQSLPTQYTPENERKLIERINELKLDGLTEDLADILAFSISEHYNDLAKNILEKDYNGLKLDPQNINQSLINQSPQQYSLLHFTAQFGNKEMLLYFIANNVRISMDHDDLSPLHSIAFAKNLSKSDFKEIMSKFEELSPGIINHKDVYNLSPLHYAAHNDNLAALEALIELGAKR